jgi:hypothetical protein
MSGGNNNSPTAYYAEDLLTRKVIRQTAVSCKVPGIQNKDTESKFSLSLRKNYTMTVSDLKLKLFRQIDTLEKGKLEEIYGVLINYINGQKDVTEWEQLSDNKKKGIIDSIDELESGKGIPNSVVIDKFRKKYNA